MWKYGNVWVAGRQPFNCGELLYTDYAQLPKEREQELGVTYVKDLDEFVG
jgi:hypothetical protein